MLWSHQDALPTVAPTRDMTDEVDALRWREALLKVSELLDHGLDNKRDLAQLLTHSLDHALKQLLIHGDDRELMALEACLEASSEFKPVVKETNNEVHNHGTKNSIIWSQFAEIGNEYYLHAPFTFVRI